ncbi:MAG: hypothetical protein AAB437_03610 [Patescibacteria group bacterium]
MFDITRNKKFLLTFFFSFIFSTAVFVAGSNFVEQTKALKAMKDDLRQGFDSLKTSQISDRDDLKKQLALLREELIRFKSQQESRTQVLGESAPTPTIQASADIKGIIKLKNNWQKAEVYQDMKASSKIIDQLIKDKLYFVYDEDPNWYKIEYDLGLYGWIQKSLVDEL